MKHPQESALLIGKYSCLALCYIKIIALIKGLNVEPLLLLVTHYDDLVKKGIMTEECFILDADKFISTIYPSVEARVSKSDTNSEQYAICTNGQHFVIVDNKDNIIWNSLDNDVAWKKLPIKSYRIVKILL